MGCGGSSASGANVKFANGHPTFKGDAIEKMFDSGKGLVYRIVDKKKKQWALYNDSKEIEVIVSVTFSATSKIKGLGHTHVEKTNAGEQVATVTVPQLGTEMFIEGDVVKFTSQFQVPSVAAPAPEAAEENQEEAAAANEGEADQGNYEGAAGNEDAYAGNYDGGEAGNEEAAGNYDAAPANEDEAAPAE